MINRPPQLDYAAAQPAWRQRKWARQALKYFVRVVIICGALLITAFALFCARQAYWARICMNYTAPPDEIEMEICLVGGRSRFGFGSAQP